MAVNVTEKKYRYFLYSQTQHASCDSIERKVSRTYVPGQVFSNGKKRLFTELSTTPENNRYADAKLVAEGYIEDMNYTLPTRKRGVR